MLGIKNYKLNIFEDTQALKKRYPILFEDLISKSVYTYYVQWHTDRNEWNTDGPIVLIIDNTQYEFTAHQLDYSLTINTINLSEKLDWYGSGDEMPLVWKKNAFEHTNTILNKKIENIFSLEFGKEPHFNLVGVEFELKETNDCLSLNNGLDCNEMRIFKTTPNEQLKRIKLNHNKN